MRGKFVAKEVRVCFLCVCEEKKRTTTKKKNEKKTNNEKKKRAVLDKLLPRGFVFGKKI